MLIKYSLLYFSVVDPHHVNRDPDPDPSFQIKAQTLKKCSNRLIFQTFCQICKLMRIRIWFRIQLVDPDPYFYLMQIWIGILFYADPDADPGYQNNGSGSTTLVYSICCFSTHCLKEHWYTNKRLWQEIPADAGSDESDCRLYLTSGRLTFWYVVLISALLLRTKVILYFPIIFQKNCNLVYRLCIKLGELLISICFFKIIIS